MSWVTVFFIAGIVLLRLWAFYTAREYQDHTKKEEITAMAVRKSVALGREMEQIAVPDVFDESRIKADLMKLAARPGAVGKYIAQAQIRFTKARQIEVLKKWTEFYNAGEDVIRARTQLARAHSTLQQVDLESEVKLKEKDARIAELEAQIEESRLKAAEARQKAADLSKEKIIEPALTREQQRLLKKAEIEAELIRVESEKTKKLSMIEPSDEEKRMLIENMYSDRIAHLHEQLSKNLSSLYTLVTTQPARRFA